MARARAVGGDLPRDLAQARQRLDEWRKTSSRGVAFPQKLWASAGRLAQRHGTYATARALGLEYSKLKRVSGGEAPGTDRGAAKTKAAKSSLRFVEVSGIAPVTASGCRVALQGPHGEQLRMDLAPSAAAELMVQLCRAGWVPRP